MVDRGTLDLSRDLSYVDPRIRSQARGDRMELLPASYTPGYWDVICHGGKENYEHSKFLDIVGPFMQFAGVPL